MLTLHSRVVCALCSPTSYSASLAICVPSWTQKKLGFYVSNHISCEILSVHDFMFEGWGGSSLLLLSVSSHSRPGVYTSILTQLRLFLSLCSHFFLTTELWKPPIRREKTQCLTCTWTTKEIWFRVFPPLSLFKDYWLNARWSRRQI